MTAVARRDAGSPRLPAGQSSSATSAAGICSDAKTKVIIILLQYAVDRHKYLVYVGYEELTADHAKPLDFTITVEHFK